MVIVAYAISFVEDADKNKARSHLLFITGRLSCIVMGLGFGLTNWIVIIP